MYTDLCLYPKNGKLGEELFRKGKVFEKATSGKHLGTIQKLKLDK